MQFQFHTSLTAKISFVTVFCYKCEENRFWHTLDSKELLPMLVIKMMGSNFLDINHYKWCKAISVPSPNLMTSFYVNLSLEPILAQVYEWTKCSDMTASFHIIYNIPFSSFEKILKCWEKYIFFFNKICCRSWLKNINRAIECT